MKCKIVLLESPTGTLMLGKDITWNIPGTFRGTKFHLHFISDDEITVGDTVYHDVFGIGTIIMKHEEECYYSPHESGGSITTPWKRNVPDIKKVVATTDQSLNLLEIPDQFINYYLDNNGDVDEIEVNKYENTIFSSSSKLFTREEVVKLFEKYTDQGKPLLYTWLKKNL